MEFWNSRAHNTRMVRCLPIISRALAMPQDLLPPRPPHRTLYRWGSKRNWSLIGNWATGPAGAGVVPFGVLVIGLGPHSSREWSHVCPQASAATARTE